MPVQSFTKTRLAPTPSGFLHLGNILSFAITAALAKKTGAKILLRIDDLDQARVNRQYLQDIFDSLDFMELPWDGGPRDIAEFEAAFSQRHRMPMYNEALEQLAGAGLVFACTCSRSRLQNGPCTCAAQKLPLNTKDAAWRLITAGVPELTVKDHNGGIIHTALPAEMESFVVRKKDGFPAYQLTSVIDDLFYGIDLIVRGQDLWPSTLAQQALAGVLHSARFNTISFYHHPLLMDTSGEKLSKSAGATSIKYLRESGKRPAEVYQLIASALGIKESVDCFSRLAECV